MRSWAWVWMGVLGCAGDKVDDTATPASPCGDGTWGEVADPATAIQVRADGDDAGDGSLESPVATLDAALALSRARSADKVIFVGPGTFAVSDLTIAGDPGDGSTDDGLVIDACDSESVLQASADDAPGVRVSGAQDVSLSRLTISGGAPGLFLWQGAKVKLNQIAVRQGIKVGVVVSGHETLVEATHLDISDTQPDGGGAGGFGLGLSAATMSLSSARISNSAVAGLFLDGDGEVGDVTLTDVEVDGTSADGDGAYGRGLQAQDLVRLVLSGGSYTNNQDAGIYVLQAADLDIEGVTVTGVTAGAVPDSEDTTGDGIVITSVDDSGALYDPADFRVTLTSNSSAEQARAGFLLEGVTAEANGNTSADGTFGLVFQGDTDLTGSDQPAATDLSGAPLDVNRAELDAALLSPAR